MLSKNFEIIREFHTRYGYKAYLIFVKYGIYDVFSDTIFNPKTFEPFKLTGVYGQDKIEHSESYLKKSNINIQIEINNQFIVGGPIRDNYFHLIVDYIPRILIYHEFNGFIYTTKYVKQKFGELPLTVKFKPHFQLATTPEEIVYCKNCYILSSHIRPFAKEAYEQFVSRTKLKSVEKIYISRSDAKFRRILNEHEICNYLQEKQYYIARLSELSLDQIVSLFTNAKTILGPHGAGLTNIIWCRNNASLLEIHCNQRYDFFIKLAKYYNFTHEFINATKIRQFCTHQKYISTLHPIAMRPYYDYYLNPNELT